MLIKTITTIAMLAVATSAAAAQIQGEPLVPSMVSEVLTNDLPSCDQRPERVCKMLAFCRWNEGLQMCVSANGPVDTLLPIATPPVMIMDPSASVLPEATEDNDWEDPTPAPTTPAPTIPTHEPPTPMPEPTGTPTTPPVETPTPTPTPFDCSGFTRAMCAKMTSTCKWDSQAGVCRNLKPIVTATSPMIN